MFAQMWTDNIEKPASNAIHLTSQKLRIFYTHRCRKYSSSEFFFEKKNIIQQMPILTTHVLQIFRFLFWLFNSHESIGRGGKPIPPSDFNVVTSNTFSWRRIFKILR